MSSKADRTRVASWWHDVPPTPKPSLALVGRVALVVAVLTAACGLVARAASADAEPLGAAAVPTVTGVDPSSGRLSAGTPVTITGTAFTGASAVKFGTADATNVVVVDDSTITALAPAGLPGPVDVTVTTPAGTSATGAQDVYMYASRPVVAVIAPAVGPFGGGDSVTILGSSFSGTISVSFGTNESQSFTVVDDETIVAVAPAGSIGTIDIIVTAPGGVSMTTVNDRYRYALIPVVTGVAPSVGPLGGGTEVTITGTSFSTATAVKFGTSDATSFSVIDDGTIVAAAPPGSAGTVDVTVVTPDGSSSTGAYDSFRYAAPPVVSGLSPGAGSPAGGTAVTITGAGFYAPATVDFGAVPATDVVVVDDTTMTATAPPGSGTVSVTVTTGGGTSSTGPASSFTFAAYTAITPVRVLDTRIGRGAPKAKVEAGRRIDVRFAGAAAVPGDASAVVLNLTTTGATASSWLVAYPKGAAPSGTSSINFRKGQTLANSVVVKLGSGGEVSFENRNGRTDLIADVLGYFPAAAAYTPLTPQRVLDTRVGRGAPAARIGARQHLDVQIAGGGSPVPADAIAVVLNVTVTDTTTSSFVTVYPTGTAVPTASTINFRKGRTLANAAVVKVGAGGKVSFYNNRGATDVIADVSGYFPAGASYEPLVPSRVLDTRIGQGAPPARVGSARHIDVRVAGTGKPVPANASAVVLNLTVTGGTRSSFVTVWSTGDALPTTSNLNARRGETLANAVVVKIGAGGKVSFYNNRGDTDVIADVVGYFPASG